MAAEWSHQKQVRLLDFGPHQKPVLFNEITGEAVEVAKALVLHFDADVAFLSPRTEEASEMDAVWVNEILDLSVHDAEDSNGPFIWSKSIERK
eukprot:2960022-Lingulodinium_polyedra.AAC.2